MKWVVHHEQEPYDVFIGRPSKFGNPFRIGFDGSRKDVIEMFEGHIYSRPHLIQAIRQELRGKVLGCHCYPMACHGDILARIANGYQLCMPLYEDV